MDYSVKKYNKNKDGLKRLEEILQELENGRGEFRVGDVIKYDSRTVKLCSSIERFKLMTREGQIPNTMCMDEWRKNGAHIAAKLEIDYGDPEDFFVPLNQVTKTVVVNKSIYDLKLFEEKVLRTEENRKEGIKRVPGGWIYFLNFKGVVNTAFIPFDDEFEFKEE